MSSVLHCSVIYLYTPGIRSICGGGAWVVVISFLSFFVTMFFLCVYVNFFPAKDFSGTTLPKILKFCANI